MDEEKHTLTLTLWQWDQILEALGGYRKRREEEYRRYRELRKLLDWTSAKKHIQGLRETEHDINCEIQYQIEGTRCDACQKLTNRIIDHLVEK
jgi:hypothetical protein